MFGRECFSELRRAEAIFSKNEKHVPRNVEPHGQALGAFQYARGRNPEQEPPAKAGARVEGSQIDRRASQVVAALLLHF